MSLVIDMLNQPVVSVGRGIADPDVVAVDFETYYDKDYDIKTLGTYSYVTDAAFSPYLVAVFADGLSYVGPLKDCPWDKITGRPWVSHNAAFDLQVFAEAQRRHYIPDWVCPCSWDCTADLSAFLKVPRNLATASERLLGTKVNKAMRDFMKGKTWEDAVRLEADKELLEYAAVDAKNCWELARKHGSKWPEFEVKISRLNRKAGSRGVHVDKDALEKSIRSLEHSIWIAGDLIPWEFGDGHDNATPLSLMKAREQCREDGIPAPTTFKEDSEESTEWEAAYADSFPWIKGVRFWRKANRLLKLLTSIKNRIRPDGTMPYMIKYFGAHTGRFSGGDGVNMQNLPRDSFDCSPMLEGEPDSFLRDIPTRELFTAGPGKTLYISDLAQIEARVLLYLVNDRDQLESIKQGFNVYESHARNTMGWFGTDLKKEDPAKYRLAKARVLGAGYGCGPVKFKAVAKMLAGIELTDKECEEVVYSFRRTNPRIVKYWYRHQEFLQKAQYARDPQNKSYSVELPSGRSLMYHNVHVEDERPCASVEFGGFAYRIWGGVITENVTQACARDVFVHGLLEVERKGLADLSFHVHDEGVWSGDEAASEDRLVEINKCMSQTPEWAEGLPLSADGIASKNYRKPD